MTEYWIKIETNSRPTLIAEGGEESLTLKDMQGAVGGLIEYCTFGRNVKLPIPSKEGGLIMAEVIDVIANEEGRIHRLKPNMVGTYAAFGVPAQKAPYAIVGDVLVHVRIPEEPQEASIDLMLELVMGIKRSKPHMMFTSLNSQEADYEIGGEE